MQKILNNDEYRFLFLEYTVILGKKPILAVRSPDERLGLAAHTHVIIALDAFYTVAPWGKMMAQFVPILRDLKTISNIHFYI